MRLTLGLDTALPRRTAEHGFRDRCSGWFPDRSGQWFVRQTSVRTLGANSSRVLTVRHKHGGSDIVEQLSGGDMIVRALEDEGVEYIFGYPGGAALHIYDAIFKKIIFKKKTFCNFE